MLMTFLYCASPGHYLIPLINIKYLLHFLLNLLSWSQLVFMDSYVISCLAPCFVVCCSFTCWLVTPGVSYYPRTLAILWSLSACAYILMLVVVHLCFVVVCCLCSGSVFPSYSFVLLNPNLDPLLCLFPLPAWMPNCYTSIFTSCQNKKNVICCNLPQFCNPFLERWWT